MGAAFMGECVATVILSDEIHVMVLGKTAVKRFGRLAIKRAVIETLEPRQLLAASLWQVQIDPTLHLALTGAGYTGTASIIPASTTNVLRISDTTAQVTADTWQLAVGLALKATTRGYTYAATPERYKVGLASEIGYLPTGVLSSEGTLSNVRVARNGFVAIDPNQKVIGFEDGPDWDYNDAYFAVTVTTSPQLTTNALSGTMGHLRWTDIPENQDGYSIEKTTDGGLTYQSIAHVNQHVTDYVVENLSPLATYAFRVVPLMSGSPGDSNTSSFVTPDPATLSHYKITSLGAWSQYPGCSFAHSASLTIADTGWIAATSAEAAIMLGVSGSVFVQPDSLSIQQGYNPFTYTFPSGGVTVHGNLIVLTEDSAHGPRVLLPTGEDGWMNVTVSEDPPAVVAISGVPQTTPEGSPITLTSSVSDPVGSPSLQWSVTRDGNAFVGESGAGSTGASFTFTPDDNGGYIATLTALDAAGAVTHDSVSIPVYNVAPTGVLHAGSVEEGTSSGLSFTTSFDPSAVDMSVGLKFSFGFTADFTGSQDVEDQSSAVFSGAIPASATQVWGRITDKDGGSTSYGPIAIAVVPTAATEFLAAAVDEFEVNLKWTDNSAIETGYRIDLSADNGATWSLAGTADVNACHYTAVGLRAATTYQFRVVALGSGVESRPATSNATTPAAPTGEDMGEKTPSITSDSGESWGTQAAGTYRVVYVGGAMRYSHDRLWSIQDYVGADGFRIRNGDQELDAPGNGQGYSTLEQAQQANGAGQPSAASVSFWHAGGDISIYLKDNLYLDNEAGTTSPKFRLEKLPSVPVVSVSVDKTAVAEGQTVELAKITFTRTGDTTQFLTVYYSVAGIATPGLDYNSPDVSDYASEASVTIPAGQSSVSVPVTALADTVVEGTETLSVSLLADAAYRLNSSPNATGRAVAVAIDDPTITIACIEDGSEEPVYPYDEENTPQLIRFVVTRTGNLSQSLTVLLTSPTGTATEGIDYESAPQSVTMPSMASSATFSIRPIWDDDEEGDETVVIGFDDAQGYLMMGDAAAVTLPASAAAPTTGPTTKSATGKIKDPFVPRIRARVALEEGRRNTVYLDTKGNWTVGIGHNMGPTDTDIGKAVFEQVTGASFDDVKAGTTPLTESQIDKLFAKDLKARVSQAKSEIPSFQKLPIQAKVVSVDLVFNMGSLAGWPSFNNDIATRNWRQAIWDLTHQTRAVDSPPSQYKIDVPNRCARNVELLNQLATEAGQ